MATVTVRATIDVDDADAAEVERLLREFIVSHTWLVVTLEVQDD
jgi:hypothetical protein